MRRFHSYGPVDSEEHFCVPRAEMVERCAAQLVGNPEKSGHYFTIWSPRQCGKTWLMRQAARKIALDHPDRFTIGMMSMQGVVLDSQDDEAVLFRQLARVMRKACGVDVTPPSHNSS